MVKEKNKEYYQGLNKVIHSFDEAFTKNEDKRLFNFNNYFLDNTKVLGRKKQAEMFYFELLRLNNQYN